MDYKMAFDTIYAYLEMQRDIAKDFTFAIVVDPETHTGIVNKSKKKDYYKGVRDCAIQMIKEMKSIQKEIEL